MSARLALSLALFAGIAVAQPYDTPPPVGAQRQRKREARAHDFAPFAASCT